MDLKKTVHLPQTAFSMKANLPTSEPGTLERWDKEGMYGQIRKARAGRPRYVLHDGPPYANGNIHLGHALNKLLKDFIVKSKTMAGFDSPYIPGWDCHGLPIEIKVDSQLGSKKAQMTAAQIRQECRKYAQKYVDLQSKSFQRLGIFGRWEDPYLTMAPAYQAAIAQAFVDFLDQGYVYKGLKPVNWCISCRTALAEAEIEYEQHKSPSIYVRFRLTSDAGAVDAALAGREVYGVIWTTTPWTIPANLAISFHPKFEYAAVEQAGAVYLIAEGLLPQVAKALGWDEPRVVAKFPGARLERAVFRHPFIERDSIGLLGEHVTLEAGTGAVHTAPGHGMDDYIVCRDYGISAYCPVDAAGRLFQPDDANGQLPAELIGKTVWQANPVVIEILKASGALLKDHEYGHSYPHCWRCHKPTIFRATEQWFISMEKSGAFAGTLRERALAAIQNVKWQPAWGEERISNMIATRPDWNISRQRVWGVPITVFYCEGCNYTVTDKKTLDPVVERFRTESADAWYARPAEELLPAGYACPQCGGKAFRKEMDILDVWFDSGASHLAVLTEKNDLQWPSDMYLEGGDQYRGWFHSSLLVGTGLKNGAPYRECATNGWTLDEQGRAMSKSLGNGIEPEEVIKKYGADVLRLWVASVQFTEDVRLSETILTRITEAYRKIRNTFRYALGNLDGFEPDRDLLPVSELQEIDQWALAQVDVLTPKVRGGYDGYQFHKSYQAIYNFCTVDLSATYFDVLKDRLYTGKKAARRSAQSALYLLTHALVRLTAPFLAYTAEEVWANLPRRKGEAASVHLALFPEAGELTRELSADQRARLGNWPRLLEVREEAQKALEVKRQEKFIGAPLEAKVIVTADAETYTLMSLYHHELPAWLVVSGVELKQGLALGVEVQKADGAKCERCWKYTQDVGADAEFATACAPCAEAVREQ
jgi:isoleucyl-tRNA synthetase